jgi:hypothetical protein
LTSTRPRSASLRLARWLLGLAIFGSTMAIGAVHVPVLLAVTGVVLAAAACAWWGAEPLRARRSATLVLWTGAGLVAWTALSVVPLPIDLLAKLSPHAADVWTRALTPLGAPAPTVATLSLDPGATRVQLLRGVAYLVTFIAASRIAVRREGVVFLERALLVTALALLVAAVLHPALGAEKVFGIYSPRRDPGLRHVAPILNSNTLSGYLNIGLCAALGHLFTPRSVWPRSLLAAFTVSIIGTQVWIASRGGLLATGVAVALIAWLSRARGPEQRGVVAPFVVPGILMVAGVVIAVLASSESVFAEVATLETSKLGLARAAFRLVPDYPLFGVGRGAFESVFPAYRTDTSHVVYQFPENVVAQWTTEWGVPAAALAFGALAYALRPTTAMARSPRAAGAWAAIACVGLQNLFDFGTEYPAMMIALATCAGIVTGGTSGVDEPRTLDLWGRPKLLVATAAAVACVAGVLVLPTLGRDLSDDRAALHAAALDARVSRPAFEALASAAMLRHPAEPYLPFTGALRAARTGEGSLLPWIERTVERALVYGPAHLLLARWLTPRSPSQARLEYRLAAEQAPELYVYEWPAIPSLVHGYDDAVELLPRAAAAGRGSWVDYIASKVDKRLPATARRLDDLAVELDPTDRAFAERRAEEALADVIAGPAAPWCTGEHHAACVADGLARAARLIEVAPTLCVGHAIHARLLLASGEGERAVAELRTAADAASDRTACLKELADVATSAKSDHAVTVALERITHAGCGDVSECVQNLRFVAGTESARGNPTNAVAAMRRATALAPDDDGLLAEFAALASKAAMHVDALKAYETLARRQPGEARWATAKDEEKAALLKGTVPF